MEDYIYRYKGNDYKYLGIGKFKNDFDGAWIDAVLYEREGHKYMREVKDFFKKFEDVSSPLYSDYEAMSSDESCIVEKGEIDSTPTMQNALKPKKQKTVTEIIHDQLGPGYVPRGHKGGRQILVKEVECKDYAQDDSNRTK